MAFAPIALTIPNYRDFKNYWLKAFIPTTTTPKVMATDNTGTTTVSKFELDKDGFPKTSGGALITPYIDGAYDLWAFPTEAEADANDTSNALRFAINVTANDPLALVDRLNPPTLAIAIADATILEDDVLHVEEHTAGLGGSGIWDAVDKTTVTINAFNIVQSTGVAALALVLRYDEEINLNKLGLTLNGVDDDSSNFELAMTEAIATGFPITGVGTLRLDDKATGALTTNSILTIDFTNMPVIYGGDITTLFERMFITSGEAFFGDDNATVKLINHRGKGIEGVSTTYWTESNDLLVRKNVPVHIHANNIIFEGEYFIRDVWGKSTNLVNYINVDIDSLECVECGGHAVTYATDSFGDAIYFGDNRGASTVNIKKLIGLTGMLGQAGDTVSLGLSRIGITFENFTANGTAGTGSIDVNIYGGFIKNYERTVHAENTGDIKVFHHDAPTISNTATLFVNLTEPAVTNTGFFTAWDMDYTQKEDHAFQDRFGLGDQFTGLFEGGTFRGLGKPFTGDVDAVPSGADVTIRNAKLLFNDSRLHGKLGGAVDYKLENCDVFDYSDEQQNASFVVSYSGGSFNTTMGSTFGNVISPAGLDKFYDLTVTNQTIDTANTLNKIDYRDDNGVSATKGKILKAVGDKLPKILSARYVFTALDTAAVTVSTILPNGTIIGGNIVDNGDGTVSPDGVLVLWSLAKIEIYK